MTAAGREVLPRQGEHHRGRLGVPQRRHQVGHRPRPDSTVVVKTKYPWAPLLADLANFNNAVLPKDYGGKRPRRLLHRHPSAPAPSSGTTWERATFSRLKTSTNYWDSRASPLLDSVTWKVVPDDNARTMQIQGGQAQINESPPFSSLEQLKGQPDVDGRRCSLHQDRLHHHEPEREALRRRARPPGHLLRHRPRGAGQDAAVRQRDRRPTPSSCRTCPSTTRTPRASSTTWPRPRRSSRSPACPTASRRPSWASSGDSTDSAISQILQACSRSSASR